MYLSCLNLTIFKRASILISILFLFYIFISVGV